MLQLCCPEPLPALLQFLYQSGVSSGRSIIIRRKKTEEIRNLQLRIFFFFHSPGRFHEAYLHCIEDGIRGSDTDALLIHP